MRIVSAAKHAALQARLTRETENAKKREAEQAATIDRLRNQLDQQRDTKPNTPIQHPAPPVGDAELRRQLNLARRANRSLVDQLERMQATHEADTRELHDLRQEVAS